MVPEYWPLLNVVWDIIVSYVITRCITVWYNVIAYRPLVWNPEKHSKTPYYHYKLPSKYPPILQIPIQKLEPIEIPWKEGLGSSLQSPSDGGEPKAATGTEPTWMLREL